MNSSLRSLSPRLFAEFLVIVVGVLTALTMDAWWQGHIERVTMNPFVRSSHCEEIRKPPSSSDC